MKGNCTSRQDLKVNLKILGLLIALLYGQNLALAATIHIPDDLETIQAGIDSAAHGDTVLVQPGTYLENVNFSGKNIVLASLFLATGDTAHISSTIIDGDSTATVVTFENGEDSTAALVGFTVQNGMSKRGGGILCTNSSPTIRCNIIRFNEARDWVDFEYCYGGGICCINSSPAIIDNSIIRNLAGGIMFFGFFGGGGGICCLSGSSPFIGDNTIRENYSRLGGGVWCADSSSPEIRGNYLHKNEVYCDEWSGDPSGGGAIGCEGTSAPEISGCAIFENDGDRWGGGIYSVDSSRPTIEGCVIYGNSAYGGGAAVFCPETTPEIKNTIIWSNNRETQLDLTIDGAPEVSYCDIQGGWAGEGNIDENPLFLDYNFEVCIQSPCLDAGDPDVLDPDGTRSDIGLYFPEHPECFAGNVWHVSGDGSDETGDGSSSNPFGTIQYAVDRALYGDTVLVHNGSYVESIDIFLKGVHLASNFIYTGNREDIYSTVLRGDSSKAIVNFEDCDTLAGIEGFTLKGGDGHYYTGLRPGINCRWSGPQIKSSVITGNLSGINCEVSHPSVTDCVLTNNVNAGIYSWTSSDVRVRSSVISGNSGNGLWMKYRCSLEATNTIIWGNFGDGIVSSPDLSTVRYCCVQDGWEGEGNIDTDPVLALSDYNVCSVSPCIDAGDPGILDPDGTRSDIGLYFEDHPGCAFGNCWYVATDGDDTSGDGSLANPFGTIQHAIDIARSGDTVIALPGGHHESIRLFAKDIILA
ncbi:MAG: right-handed parallel beta-helix repeat-containing protein, partial [Candidatus Zixiibacteriota bacterium]